MGANKANFKVFIEFNMNKYKKPSTILNTYNQLTNNTLN